MGEINNDNAELKLKNVNISKEVIPSRYYKPLFPINDNNEDNTNDF